MNGLEGFDTLMRKHPVWPMEQTIPREFLPGQGGEASIFQGPVSILDPLGGLFGGKGAVTRSPGMLKEARRLMKLLKGTAKKVSEKVRKKTGWFKGLDDKWRFEIDDSKMKWADPKKALDTINKNQPARLGDIIEHDELFDAYPALKDINIKVKDGIGTGERGSYYIDMFGEETITLNRGNMPRGLVDAKEILTHEIQHGIQETEGFARGGNPQEMAKVHSNILVDLNKQVAEINIQLTDAVGTPMYNELLELRQGIVTEIQKIEGPEGIGVLDKGFADYKRLAGEIESRDAASRMDFGPLQRTQARPDIDRPEAIVQYGLRGEAGQVGPVKTPNENLRGKVEAKISTQESFEGAAQLILNEPNTTSTQFLYGKESLIGENKDFYTYITPKGAFKGRENKFIVNKWQRDDGIIRYTVHQKNPKTGEPYSQVSSAVQFEVKDGRVKLLTIASEEKRIGLGKKLLKEVEKDYGKFTYAEPISKQGAKLIESYLLK